MISLSTITSSENQVVFDEIPLSNPESQLARISRSKTLDNECVIVHSGVTDADRTLAYISEFSEATASLLKYIFKNYTIITVANNDGVFHAAMSQFENDGGKVTMTFLVKEKI